MSKKLAPHTEAMVLNCLETAYDLERRLDRSLSVRGISFSEYRLLRKLAASGSTGSPRIDLAGAVGLTPSAITRALKPLEKLGLVKTSRNLRDARQSLAVLTAAGGELLSDAQTVLADVLLDLPINALNAQQVAEFHDRLQELRVR